ncbi:MAG: Hpt domain-containing protein, partial [Deltaproteobacteria bacterium]|nr:Hpt domain-containing protein [Deltaproteobacteria bacterium]
MIDTEILDDYCSEARELLDEMDNSLMRLEKEGGTPELLNTIFRAVHCIKGSAEYIGLERSSTLTHGVENLLDRLRENAMKLTPAVVDFLFRAKDLISILISEVSQHRVERSEISLTMEQLDRFLAGTATEPADMAPEMPRAEITQREPSFEEARTTEEVPEFPVVPEEELGEFLPIEEMPTVLVEEEAYPVEYFPEIEATEAAEERPPVLEALPGEAALPEAPEEFVTRGEEEMAEAVGELEEPGAIEQFSLEDTVPHILSIS